jgi:hypothetical protein
MRSPAQAIGLAPRRRSAARGLPTGSCAAALLAALTACGAPEPPSPPSPSAALSVTSPAAPYTYADGARARRDADAQCGAGGVLTSINDRYEDATATWVFVEGCA